MKLLKDYLIENSFSFKEDKEGFIHVLGYSGYYNPFYNDLTRVGGVDYTLLKSVKGSLLGSNVEINCLNLKYVGGWLYGDKAGKREPLA